MNAVDKSPVSALLWSILMLFILGSLLAALHWYFTQDLAGFSLSNFSQTYLALAILLQVFAIGTVLLSWYLNLRLQDINSISFRESIVMVGISAIGKYTPGKIWGMVARGAVVYQHTGQSRHAFVSAFVEQLALVHSGAMLALCFFVGTRFGLLPAILVLAVLIPSIWWLARSEQLLLYLVSKFRKQEVSEVIGFSASYPAVCMTLMVMWLFASAVLWFTMLAYGIDSVPLAALVFLASLLSYLGGFVAFFAPAGIGVREGIIVTILGPIIGVGAALYISLLQRLITAGVDILLGCLALLLFTNKK